MVLQQNVVTIWPKLNSFWSNVQVRRKNEIIKNQINKQIRANICYSIREI